MSKKTKEIIGTGIMLILIVAIFFIYIFNAGDGNSKIAKKNYQDTNQSLVKKTPDDEKQPKSSYVKYNNSLLKPSYTILNNGHSDRVVDWNKPTSKSYIDLNDVPADKLKIVVDENHQILNIYNDNKLVEQFLISSGKDGDTATPKGNFEIQPQHGTWFYNDRPDVNEGARNWISFKDNGVYLFHSVVMDKNNEPIMSRQGKLGEKNSHGCIQMSLPDNKWFYDTFSQPDKVGTKVVIE